MWVCVCVGRVWDGCGGGLESRKGGGVGKQRKEEGEGGGDWCKGGLRRWSTVHVHVVEF